MHNRLAEVPALLLDDCSKDLFSDLPVCLDITIDVPTTWSPQTITCPHYMCPKQKIIITQNASLTIDNCLVTTRIDDGPNPNCPELVDNSSWDGIYLEGANGPSLSPNTPTLPTQLTIQNNSIIENSLNGIQASTGGGIEINRSILRNNLKAIYLKENWSSPGNVYNPLAGFCKIVNNSLIKVPIGVKGDETPQIKIKGVWAQVSNSKITYDGVPADHVNGIYSQMAGLSIEKSSLIENFYTAIDKDGDKISNSSRGLSITNSNTKNCTNAIKNESVLTEVINNWIEGDVNSDNTTHGTWTRNNFKNSVSIFDPTESNVVSNNFFDESTLQLSFNNSNTLATCNTWDPHSIEEFEAVWAESNSSLPLAWGEDALPSGNRYVGTFATDKQPSFNSINSFINNYHTDNTKFKYKYNFRGKNATGNIDCSYTYRTSLTNPGLTNTDTTTVFNFNDEETNLNGIDTQISYYQNLLQNTPQGQLYDSYMEKLNLLKIERGQSISKAISHLDTTNTQTEWDFWCPLIDSRTLILDTIYTYWNNEQFDDLQTYLSNIQNLDTYDGGDKDNLEAAVEYLYQKMENEKDIYFLNDNEVDTLKEIALLSYGDFTGILRYFLSFYYNIHIELPNTIYERVNSNPNIRKDHISNNISLFPNPTSNCFRISINNFSTSNCAVVDLFNTNGHFILEKKITANNSELCFDNIEPGLYFINIKLDDILIEKRLKLIITNP